MNRDDIKEFLELSLGLKKSSRMLAEAEGDDPFADDEEGGEEEEGGDEEGGEEEGGEEESDEEEVKVSKDDEVELGKSLDNSLTALFVDIETDALKSAAIEKENKEESYSLKSALLNESEEPSLDIERFASETARIIKNADVLLDIEEIILSKARDYLLSKYDPEIEKKFLEIMLSRFDIDTRTESEKDEEKREIPTPIAVGASGGGAAG